MRILSATEAVSPAIARMKLLLFKPFRFGRSWKLAATGYLAGSSALFLPLPLVYLTFIPFARRAGAPASAIALIVAEAAIFLAIYFVIFYLCSRLSFAFFDITLNRGEFVAPAWRKYGPQSRKWTLFKIALGTLVSIPVAALMAPMVKGMINTFANLHLVQGKPSPPEFTADIFSMYGAFFVIYFFIGIFAILNSVLEDFVVPSLALEDVPLREALQRAGRLVRNEFRAVCFYTLIKAFLYIVGIIAVFFCFNAFLFAVILIAVILGALVYFVLDLLHVPSVDISTIAIGAGTGLYLFTILYGMFLAYGTVYTLTESYALYFLGGRFPLLGDALDRSTLPPESYIPPPNYLAYTTPPSAPEPPAPPSNPP
jgi:hypothetical protein